jgi:hypothetical protein
MAPMMAREDRTVRARIMKLIRRTALLLAVIAVTLLAARVYLS